MLDTYRKYQEEERAEVVKHLCEEIPPQPWIGREVRQGDADVEKVNKQECGGARAYLTRLPMSSQPKTSSRILMSTQK